MWITISLVQLGLISRRVLLLPSRLDFSQFYDSWVWILINTGKMYNFEHLFLLVCTCFEAHAFRRYWESSTFGTTLKFLSLFTRIIFEIVSSNPSKWRFCSFIAEQISFHKYPLFESKKCMQNKVWMIFT